MFPSRISAHRRILFPLCFGLSLQRKRPRCTPNLCRDRGRWNRLVGRSKKRNPPCPVVDFARNRQYATLESTGTMNGKSHFLLPSLESSDRTSRVLGNFFPGIEHSLVSH
jgi:hypothetical protein